MSEPVLPNLTRLAQLTEALACCREWEKKLVAAVNLSQEALDDRMERIKELLARLERIEAAARDVLAAGTEERFGAMFRLREALES